MRISACLLLLLSPAFCRNLERFFTAGLWEAVHCDIVRKPEALQATMWKGYETTGFSTTNLPVRDWSRWKSFQFDVDNSRDEPLSVYVRLSNRSDHPRNATYTGGTFDGFVIGPGRSTVEISLENMKSRDQSPVDPGQIAWIGIYVSPLFLRDGQELRFAEDLALQFSNARLEQRPAKLQKQPYAEPLFDRIDPSVGALKEQTDEELATLAKTIAAAKAKGFETAYAEIYPFLANMAMRSRLVAFWQDRALLQKQSLETLLNGARNANRRLLDVMAGKAADLKAPALPSYADLTIRDGYFRNGQDPILLFGMLYNRSGPLLRWFANSQTDYGTELVAGGTRHDVERQPIWEAYHKYPDTHRVGWDHADHIIRDASSWEVLGEPVNVCLESPHSREAIAKMIENYELSHRSDRAHLVQNMGFEYTYVCYCPYTKRMWADWLERRHKDIATANRIWKTQYARFADVPMPRREQAGNNRALWFDWASFNQHRFLEQIRWTRDQIRRWEPDKPLTVGSPYFAFDAAFWTGVDEEELADSGITNVVLEENYSIDTLMPEYLHALANGKPVTDFEHHGVIHEILPSFLHGDAGISMWWWNDAKHWTPNEPINEWTSSFPQSYTIPLADVAKAMRDALDLRRLNREIAAFGSAPRQVALLYSKSSMLQQHVATPESSEAGTFPYLSTLRRLYNASQSVGLYVGITTEKKILSGDLDRYRVLILPGAAYVQARAANAMLEWVESGGFLIVSPDSLLADEYTRPLDIAGSLGIRITRREPPKLNRGETIVTDYNFEDLPRVSFNVNGQQLWSAGGRQMIECDRALVAATFPDGAPALLHIRKGKGAIYWLASPLTPPSWRAFLTTVAAEGGLRSELELSDAGLEYRTIRFAGRHLAYFYNASDQAAHTTLSARFNYEQLIDLRTGAAMNPREIEVPPRETMIVEFR